MKHTVLLGNPGFFRIKGGNNPYTRNRWGFRKKVDSRRAMEEWGRFRDTLESLGAKVLVLPPQKDFPGMVFPANAGFLHPKYARVPWTEKRFYLSNLSAHRKGETAVYENFFRGLGLETKTLPFLFEGEADFFPAGEFYLFTYGEIVRTGFGPAAGWPPYRYRFSHRSDKRNLEALRLIAAGKPVLGIRLVDTRYYHGDTALFAFGEKRENLLVYPPALDRESYETLSRHFGARLIPLDRADAERFAANSFQLDGPDGPHLVIPEALSDALLERFRSLGLPFTEANVSEFFSKGGGSIKCLLCDLGYGQADTNGLINLPEVSNR